MDAAHPLSSQTFSSSPWPHKADLDLSSCPPIFVSATYFDSDDLHDLEDDLAEAGATLTYDAREAGIVMTKVLKPKRVQFDLRARGVWTEEVKAEEPAGEGDGLSKKRRKVSKAEKDGKTQQAAIPLDDESTESESEIAARATRKGEDEVDRPHRHGENQKHALRIQPVASSKGNGCLLYTSDAADE